MPSLSKHLDATRKLAIAALMGATCLATALSVAHADPASSQATQANPTAGASKATAKTATSDKPETVEQRINSLHASLKITPAEESKWTEVAQAMRENASQIEKLVADKHLQAGQKMTAVDDLMTYQEFAQAHVDGLKNLTVAFKSLYDTMSDSEKKNADSVFQSFGSSNTHASR